MPVHSRPRDEWLLPLLNDLLPAEAVSTVAETNGDSFWQAAVDLGFIDEQDLLAEIARRSHAPIASRVPVSEQVRRALPESLVRRYQVLPLAISESTLEVATSNPYDIDCEQMLSFVSGLSVRMSLAPPRLIAEQIEDLYGGNRASGQFRADGAPRAPKPYNADRVLPASGREPATETVTRLVDRIVADGISQRASDIHLEPEETGIAVRYRVDGLLHLAMLLPKAVGLPLVSRIKIMATMDIADRLRPQGGHASVELGGTRVDLRVSTLPASHGEKVVIRILDPRSAIRSLEFLGLDAIDAPRMKKLLDVREGLVLVTGPTGSGKTTTLYAALREIQQRGLNIVTVEDPVEYRIQGIVQVQINEKAGLTFASALRSILRQDPDVVLIGEIRDRETAAIAVQAALTGHLVFATLHTRDACSSITRLTDLGVESAKLAVALKGIVAQRLIRSLCVHCRLVANSGAPVQLRPSVPEGVMVLTAAGCNRCAMSGYHGRIAVTEIVVANAALERAIAGGVPVDSLESTAREGGARSLWQSGVSHLLQGETSGDELLRVLEQELPGPADSPGAVRNELWDLFDSPPSGRALYDSGNDRAGDISDRVASDPDLTALTAGVVDVYVIRPLSDGWKVLAVQRAPGTRCPGAWETIHGRLDAGERPEHGAVREVWEETSLTVVRLYNVTVQPFYLHMFQTVQLAVVFAAFVDEPAVVTLGEEHRRHEWLTVEEAAGRFVWPREREALTHIRQLLAGGDAGPVEDVLRVF